MRIYKPAIQEKEKWNCKLAAKADKFGGEILSGKIIN